MFTPQLVANALRAAANVFDPSPNAGSGTQLAATPAPVAPALTASTVTAEQITQLIQPHIGNEAIKAALGGAMRTLGINALPEAPPHLFGQLYQVFQGVLAAHGIGGAAQPNAAPASII